MIATTDLIESQSTLLTTPNGSVDQTQENYSYHDDYSRISASMLKVFVKSRREYEGLYITGEATHPEAKPHMNLGSVVHAVFLENTPIDELVLEYPAFCFSDTGRLSGSKAKIVRDMLERSQREPIESMFYVLPEKFTTPSGAVSKSKDSLAFQADNKDRHLLTNAEAVQIIESFSGKDGKARYAMKSTDLESAKAIVERLKQHDFAKWCSLGRAIAEESLYWTHKATGIECRCKPDILIPHCRRGGSEFTFFADLKVTIAWSKDDFGRYLSGRFRGSQRGWVQASMYADGIIAKHGATDMRFVCANPEWPHQVRVHPIDEMSFDGMREKFEEAMSELKKCYETGDWSDPDEFTEAPVIIGPGDLV